MQTMTVRRVVVVITALMLTVAMAVPASAAIKIHRIAYDPPGRDTRQNAQLNREMIVLRNTGANRRNIGGWTVRDRAGHRYTVPAGFRLGAGRYVRIHTGRGRNDSNDLYWRRGWYVWNNTGDRATLKNRRGTVVDRCRYSGGGSSVRC